MKAFFAVAFLFLLQSCNEKMKAEKPCPACATCPPQIDTKDPFVLGGMAVTHAANARLGKCHQAGIEFGNRILTNSASPRYGKDALHLDLESLASKCEGFDADMMRDVLADQHEKSMKNVTATEVGK